VAPPRGGQRGDPARIRRAIPDAWAYATPAEVLDARAAAAAAALRRLLPGGEAERIAAGTCPRRLATGRVHGTACDVTGRGP